MARIAGHYPMDKKTLYGYQALRVRRQILLNELLATIDERHVPVHFKRKFSKVLEESDDGVTFGFEDGANEKADLLLGADGIHSKIRNYVCPSNPPRYNGFFAYAAYIPTSKLRLLYPDYPPPVSMAARPGFFLIAP